MQIQNPLRVAVVDDDVAFASTLVSWIQEAQPTALVDRYFTKRDAVRGVETHRYDVVTVDLELENKHDADGLAVIRACQRSDTPSTATALFIVSGNPEPQRWRTWARALEVKDYFEKDTDLRNLRTLFIDSFQGLVSTLMARRSNLLFDNEQGVPTHWKGKKLVLCESERLLLGALFRRRNDQDPTLAWEDAFKVVKTGTTKANVRKIAAELRKEFIRIDPSLKDKGYPIANQYGEGYAWKEPPQGEI